MNKFIVTIHRKDEVLTREVTKDSFTVGRSVDCDISLNDPNISRVHLVINRRWNQIWIEDKNSSNGTFLNGTKVVQGTPINVVPSDRLQLGRSEYILNIDLEVEETPPEPAPEEEPMLEKTVAMPPPNMAPFQAEKILHDAKRKAAQIILEGETQAEKRVQAIYQKAREAQAQAEIFQQTRIAEAHKEADAILTEFQKQGQELLHEARSLAQEIREEVDSYVQSLRQKAKKDAEDIVSEATLTAEKLKDEALAQGREYAKKESDEYLRVTREEADRVLDFAKMKAEEVQARVQQEISEMETAAIRRREEISAEILKIQTEGREQAERMSADLAAKRLELERLHQDLREKAEESQRAGEALHLLKERGDDLRGELLRAQENLSSLRAQYGALSEQKATMESALKGLQDKQAHLHIDISDLERKKEHSVKDYEAQKILLKEKLDKERVQMSKAEEERQEELRLEAARRQQKIEQEILDEVFRKKTSMVKEIHAAIEKEVVLLMEPEKWRKISPSVEGHISDAFEGKVASLSQSSVAGRPVNVAKKRKNEKIRWVGMGLAMGALGYFVSQMVVDKVSRDQTPMQTRVSNEAKKRQEDLEKRRFNPPQVEEVKETYTDSVIYTRNYVDIYTEAQFQQRLYKAASQYLLKTWRVDEDKSIQLISSANALVKELADRKSKIHPDFVKEGIEKMRALESQSLARMKEILGTEVRLESYLKFERNFYMEEVQRRRIVQY